MFNLERAIRSWRRGLAKSPSLEDTYVDELEAVLRDEIAALVRGGTTEEEAFRHASSEMGDAAAVGDEFEKVRRPGRSRFMPALVLNYLKVAGRKFKRQKAYSFITLAGLMTGMAAFFLILLYCRFERGYDGLHRNGDRIYRVQNDRVTSARHDRSAGCPPGLAAAMKEEFPEIADYARLYNIAGDPNTVTRTSGSQNQSEPEAAGRTLSFFESRIFFADPALLRVFSFPLARGDAETALEDPEAVVLTESTARKYFGDEDPLGQTITVTTRFGRHDYRVTGVCRDVPPNSHLRFDLLLSFRRLAVLWPSSESQPWSNNSFLTYILIAPSADPRSLEAKFPLLIKKHSLDSADEKREFHLQPLRTIHLNSRLRWEADVNGDIKTVKLLEIIGLFILLIAWVNSINLATARSLQRGKEVCVRKTLGAEKRQLTGQFLFESVLHNTLAFLLAMGAVLTALPAFSRLVGKPLSPGQLGAGWIWVSLAILAGALLSGLYPAFILSSFRPSLALRGPAKGATRGTVLRKGLVLLQFATASLLIASTLIVGDQLAFMRSRELGAEIGQTLVLKIPPADGSGSRLIVARDQMAGIASVLDATVSTSVPGREYSNAASGIRRQSASEEEAERLFFIGVDDRYFQLFRIPMLSGRAFSEGYGSDRDAVILNEEAVKLLDLESGEKALQQNIVLGGLGGQVVRVIGVVKNYHHKSLREKIEPVVYQPLRWANLLSLKIQGPSIRATVSSVEAKWKEIFPGRPLEYFFLDDDFNGQYDADKRFGRVFGLGSLLAVVIACLGLFGLASFSAERRRREIGIRKVFGASAWGLAGMLAVEFLRWILLANFIAWPVAWISMGKWLRRFAYHTTVGLETLGGAALLTLIIALATVSAKTLRSAAANPVDSIRCE